MNTFASRVEGEGGFMQQRLQIQIGALADQFQVEAIGLADGLAALEFEHLEVVLDAFEGKREVGFIGRVEHWPPCPDVIHGEWPALPTVRCGRLKAATGPLHRCCAALVECQRQTQRQPAMRGQLRRALRGAVQLHGFGLTGAEPAIRVAAAGQFIEHAGQGVNIRRGGQLATVEQLQCGITRRPGGEARAAQAWQTGQQPFQRLSGAHSRTGAGRHRRASRCSASGRRSTPRLCE